MHATERPSRPRLRRGLAAAALAMAGPLGLLVAGSGTPAGAQVDTPVATEDTSVKRGDVLSWFALALAAGVTAGGFQWARNNGMLNLNLDQLRRRRSEPDQGA